MKIPLYLLFLLMILACSKKQEPDYGNNFYDKIISFAINNEEDKYIELPDLYEKTTDYIPEDKDENLKLAEKLKIRGFKVVDFKRQNFQFEGQQIITLTLKKGNCQCEVSKIYYSTSKISEYRRTERIKCIRVN